MYGGRLSQDKRHLRRQSRDRLQALPNALGHIHRCDRCGSEVPVYNACQTRHCPTCQTSAKEKWLDARFAEVLPVQGFISGPGLSACLATVGQTLVHQPSVFNPQPSVVSACL